MQKQNVRQDIIMQELRLRGYASIKEMAAKFDVSEMTIRRDFRALEANSAIKNLNGMLVYGTTQNSGDYELDTETVKNNGEKSAIGRFAATLVQPEDIIILDTGTTTVHVAANLPEDINLTTLCYSSNVLRQLQRLPRAQILMAGGHYHANSQMFESIQGIRFIRETRAHKVFVSAAGIHADLGLTCVEGYELATKKAVLESAAQKILVADYTKFGVIHASYFCNLQDIDIIVTNKLLAPEWENLIRELGIELYLV